MTLIREIKINGRLVQEFSFPNERGTSVFIDGLLVDLGYLDAVKALSRRKVTG